MGYAVHVIIDTWAAGRRIFAYWYAVRSSTLATSERYPCCSNSRSVGDAAYFAAITGIVSHLTCSQASRERNPNCGDPVIEVRIALIYVLVTVRAVPSNESGAIRALSGQGCSRDAQKREKHKGRSCDSIPDTHFFRPFLPVLEHWEQFVLHCKYARHAHFLYSLDFTGMF